MDGLTQAFVDEVEALPSAAPRRTAGGDGWRTWRRLADRGPEALRGWFTTRAP